VEEIEDELVQKVRYLENLIDELAKGKKMEKIFGSKENQKCCIIEENRRKGCTRWLHRDDIRQTGTNAMQKNILSYMKYKIISLAHNNKAYGKTSCNIFR